MKFMLTYCHFFHAYIFLRKFMLTYLEISKVATNFIQTLWMKISLVIRINGVSFNI